MENRSSHADKSIDKNILNDSIEGSLNDSRGILVTVKKQGELSYEIDVLDSIRNGGQNDSSKALQYEMDEEEGLDSTRNGKELAKGKKSSKVGKGKKGKATKELGKVQVKVPESNFSKGKLMWISLIRTNPLLG